MQETNQLAPAATRKLWAGRILSGLGILFLLVDGIMKLVNPAPVVEGMTRLGYPLSLTATIGIILLICVLVHAIPRTSILGAILLTGYLGGAVASQLRVGEPLFTYVLVPIYIAALIWGGLYLRDDRVRALIQVRG
jgi:hypothetical protein